MKNQEEVALKIKLNKINSYLMKFINQLLGSLEKEKCVLLLKTIFWVLT